jgi:antitoxin component YwqK of YwqJK toxin-antitoxin module
MNSPFKLLITGICLMQSLSMLPQSREALIILEFQNYESKEMRGEVVGEGEYIDGKPHGKWVYYLSYNHNLMYYKGYYEHGKKTGIWQNYALIPPPGYTENYNMPRSSESWKEGKLYRFKMGQDNLLLTFEDGLGEPYVSELRRLDEAFENSFRRTSGKTYTPEFGESLESIQSRILPMIRTELLKSKQKAELKFWTLYNKLKLYEIYDSGQIVSKVYQSWEKEILYRKEIYINEMLTEKYLYIEGDPSNIMAYRYYPSGDLEYLKYFKNDTVPTGRWIKNYQNGERKFQGNYCNGKKNGKWKYWDETGELKVIKYIDGEPIN